MCPALGFDVMQHGIAKWVPSSNPYGSVPICRVVWVTSPHGGGHFHHIRHISINPFSHGSILFVLLSKIGVSFITNLIIIALSLSTGAPPAPHGAQLQGHSPLQAHSPLHAVGPHGAPGVAGVQLEARLWISIYRSKLISLFIYRSERKFDTIASNISFERDKKVNSELAHRLWTYINRGIQM